MTRRMAKNAVKKSNQKAAGPSEMNNQVPSQGVEPDRKVESQGGLGSLPAGSYQEFFTRQIGRQKIDRFFRCTVNKCGQEFDRSSSLVVHVRQHFAMKLYQCPICQKTFTQAGSVKRHLEFVHPLNKDD